MMHMQMIRVPVQALCTECEDDVRTNRPNVRYEPGGRGIDRDTNEGLWVLRGRGSSHPRIAVTEQANVRHADLSHRLAQLPFADHTESLRVVETGNRALAG